MKLLKQGEPRTANKTLNNNETLDGSRRGGCSGVTDVTPFDRGVTPFDDFCQKASRGVTPTDRGVTPFDDFCPGSPCFRSFTWRRIRDPAMDAISGAMPENWKRYPAKNLWV